MNKKYVHDKSVHNLKDPKIIVEEILKHFSPKSVIDLWCGLGTFVKVFQDYWIDAYWVNWEWVEKDKLFIDEKSLIIKNLEEFYDFWKKYDLAISLEVAEHIDEKYSDNFVKTLISCSDYIVFSAATSCQWWQNHVNEQRPEYREKKFNKYWYKFYDVFRHVFWDNKNIFWRYKQNMFLIVKEWKEIPNTLVEKWPKYVIHPELFEEVDIRKRTTKKLIKEVIYRIYINTLGKCLKAH